MARFALALVISVWLVGTAVSTEFLRYVEDLPLASGLVEDTSAITVFDKPNGRIVETRASGRLSSVAGVMTFYRENTAPTRLDGYGSGVGVAGCPRGETSLCPSPRDAVAIDRQGQRWCDCSICDYTALVIFRMS